MNALATFSCRLRLVTAQAADSKSDIWQVRPTPSTVLDTAGVANHSATGSGSSSVCATEKR